jgi:fermentation-respiration switch protein FrsA (DUF1100 family)
VRFVVRVLLLAGGAWAAAVGAAFLLQRRMMYFPDPTDPAIPPGRGIEDVTLVASDGVRLRAWLWPGTRDAVLLVFHGNAGNRANRLEWMEPFHDRGWGVLLLDYRGYGGSGGRPTEEGLARDADAAVAFLEARGHRTIVHFAESLGCGVAVAAAVRRPPAAMVLHSGAVSLAQVAKRAYPWLPAGLLMKDRFDCEDTIGGAGCPVLVVHGSRDELIPPALGRALYDAAAEPKEWYEVEGAGHNDLPFVGGRAYVDRVHSFLAAAISRR